MKVFLYNNNSRNFWPYNPNEGAKLFFYFTILLFIVPHTLRFSSERSAKSAYYTYGRSLYVSVVFYF